MWQNIFGFSDNCIDNCIWAGGCGFSLLLWGGSCGWRSVCWGGQFRGWGGNCSENVWGGFNEFLLNFLTFEIESHFTCGELNLY